MNANELLEIMRAGGKVIERWKPRSFIMRPRRQVILTYPDGTQQFIQRSCVDPLIKRGLVSGQEMPFDVRMYRLTE